MITDVVTTK